MGAVCILLVGGHLAQITAGAILRLLGSIECARGLNRLNAIVTLAVENILTTVGLFNPIGEAVTEDEASDLEAQA